MTEKTYEEICEELNNLKKQRKILKDQSNAMIDKLIEINIAIDMMENMVAYKKLKRY